MPYYNKDPKRDPNFDNHPCVGPRSGTAAIEAARNGHIDMVHLLIEKGPDKDKATDHGVTLGSQIGGVNGMCRASWVNNHTTLVLAKARLITLVTGLLLLMEMGLLPTSTTTGNACIASLIMLPDASIVSNILVFKTPKKVLFELGVVNGLKFSLNHH